MASKKILLTFIFLAIGGGLGWIYYLTMPCIASCSGGKMHPFIPVFIGTATGGLALNLWIAFNAHKNS
jgi:hypothetical protein